MRAISAHRTAALLLGAASSAVALGPARAEEPSPTPVAPPVEATPAAAPEPESEAYRELVQRSGRYARFLGTLGFGTGLRFDNPYRLRTELGHGGESVSLTAGYFDLGAAVAFGAPNGLQNGFALHLSTALAGVGQSVLTPSWLVAYRGPHRAMAFARLGAANILGPDFNVGGELAAGGAYFLTAGIAVTGEAVGDLFLGAGTRQVASAVYPILSGQLGLLVDYELLP
jgi:hypothetical protein